MKYFLEIWLQGFAKDYIRGLSIQTEKNHPHITLVRPFTLPNQNEKEVKSEILKVCSKYEPVRFSLEGSSFFSQGVNYVPVLDSEKTLAKLDGELESILSDKVSFVEKFSDEKVLHATISFGEEQVFDVPYIEQYMLRLTLIRDKKIWFSYDFFQKSLLNREESLSKDKWAETVFSFLEKNNLEITKSGFKKVLVDNSNGD